MHERVKLLLKELTSPFSLSHKIQNILINKINHFWKITSYLVFFIRRYDSTLFSKLLYFWTQTIIRLNQPRWFSLTDMRLWIKTDVDRCSGVTGSTLPGWDEPFDLRWGSLLLQQGASCLSQAAKQSPRRKTKKRKRRGSVGQMRAYITVVTFWMK